MKILHTCSPHLSDVATLPWKVKKVSFNSIVYTYFWLLNIFFRLVKRLYRHYINHNQILFTLTFRSLSEIVVRRSFSILLPVLATVVMWRGKKSVVRVAQNLQSWIRYLREVPDGLRKQCTSERREGVLWTGTRTVIHWATRTSFCSKKKKVDVLEYSQGRTGCSNRPWLIRQIGPIRRGSLYALSLYWIFVS